MVYTVYKVDVSINIISHTKSMLFFIFALVAGVIGAYIIKDYQR